MITKAFKKQNFMEIRCPVIIVFFSLYIMSCTQYGIPSLLGLIVTIESSLSPIKEGEFVIYTINYENISDSDTYSNVKLKTTYDNYFEFIDSSLPPNRIIKNHETLYVIWEVDPLSPGQSGVVWLKLKAIEEIDQEVYEIYANAEIDGLNQRIIHNRSFGKSKEYLYGRSTPTSKRTHTNTPNLTKTFF